MIRYIIARIRKRMEDAQRISDIHQTLRDYALLLDTDRSDREEMAELERRATLDLET